MGQVPEPASAGPRRQARSHSVINYFGPDFAVEHPDGNPHPAGVGVPHDVGKCLSQYAQQMGRDFFVDGRVERTVDL